MDNRLKEVREEKGISKISLSRQSGVSRMTINKIENGENISINTSTILKISEALGESPSKIFSL